MFTKQEKQEQNQGIFTVAIPVFAAQAIAKNQRAAKRFTQEYAIGNFTTVLDYKFKNEKYFIDPRKDIRLTAVKVLHVLSACSEQKILSLLEKFYQPMIKAIKEKKRFEQFLGSAPTIRPAEIIDQFSIYKLTESVMDSYQEPDAYEDKLLMIMEHWQYKGHSTFENDCELAASAKRVASVNRHNIFSAFASDELYGFLNTVMLMSDMSMDLIETVPLTDKDYQDILLGVEELKSITYEENTYSTKITKGGYIQIPNWHKRPENDKYLNQVLLMIGSMVKVFSKLYKEKEKELEKALSEKKVETVIKEDTASKKLAEQKQQQLNRAQVQIDRLEKEKEKLQDKVSELEDYIKEMNKAQDYVEKIQEEDPNAKPCIPLGDGVVLLGGHPRWQSKLAEKYPHIRMIEADVTRLDLNIIKNAKHILMNVNHMPHKLFHMVISTIRSMNKDLKYVW